MANYLRFADESAADAIRTVTSSPRPREAARELPTRPAAPRQSITNARSAFWTEVERRGCRRPVSMATFAGTARTCAMSSPIRKRNAVAQELWSSDPGDLQEIRRVFDALAQSEGSTRARAAGSSGTAQSLSGKLDPSLTAASIASRARSVNRGQLSPTIAVVDVVATWLRGRSAQVQSRAIDAIASAVVNNPKLAADLLEKYNPADYAARRRLITQQMAVGPTNWRPPRPTDADDEEVLVIAAVTQRGRPSSPRQSKRRSCCFFGRRQPPLSQP